MCTTKSRRGFTLIELLVVVLIIGILVAVALPQYQKAVEKSKAAGSIALLKSAYQAYKSYYLANGTYPTSFKQLDLDIPWKHRPDLASGVILDVYANDTWRIFLNRDSGKAFGIVVRIVSGKYEGGSFYMWGRYDFSGKLPLDTILCAERISSISQEGDYCHKIFNGTKIFTGSEIRYYRLP